MPLIGVWMVAQTGNNLAGLFYPITVAAVTFLVGTFLTKDTLDVNVELAAPDQFIPALPGWRERSEFIAEQVFYPGFDGTRIPISLVYRRGLRRDALIREAREGLADLLLLRGRFEVHRRSSFHL